MGNIFLTSCISWQLHKVTGILVAAQCLDTGPEEDEVAKEDRGFASMDRGKQREIASKGGKAAHQKGTAHEWTSEEAREAGRKGGMASHRRKQEQQPAPDVASAGAPESTSGSVNPSRSPAATTCRKRVRRHPGASRGACRRHFGTAIIGGSRQRLALGRRSTVGHLPLEQVIGVRIPASQPNSLDLRSVFV